MRLALLTDSNLDYADGVGRVLREWLKYLAGRPQDAALVVHRALGEEATEQRAPNVTTCSLRARFVPVPGYDAYPFAYVQSPARRVLERLRAFGPDVIVTVTPYIPRGIGRASLRTAAQLGVACVGSYDVHLSAASEPYARRILPAAFLMRPWNAIVRGVMRAYARCDAILVPSEYVRTEVALRFPDRPTVTVPRGVDPDRFSPAHRTPEFKRALGLTGRPVLLYVGRLSLEKNLHTLARVYARLRRRHPELAWVLVGEGPVRGEIERMGLPDVYFAGVLRGAALGAAYASADVFAFPSRVETAGMVVLEAMASGLPAVVFDAGGARDPVEHGISGFVAKDEQELEGYADVLLADPERRRSVGRAARESARTQHWERTFDELGRALAPLARRP